MLRERTEAVARGAAAATRARPANPLAPPGRLLLSLQETAGNRAVAGLVQRQFEDEDKVGEDDVGYMRGPAEREENADPQPERVTELGLIDGEITSDVHPHAFTDGGRVGEGTWHHCGGTGGKGVETLGEATTVAPQIKTSPAGKDGVAKAWVRKGTGTVKVKRSYYGVTHGKQGAYTAPPPGTVWMSPRARARVDEHERKHVKKTKEIHDQYIKPLEDRIDRYRGLIKSKKGDKSESEARAALLAEIDWNAALNDFKTKDTAENKPMGPVDTDDLKSADFYKDYKASKDFKKTSGCDIYEGVGASTKGKTT